MVKTVGPARRPVYRETHPPLIDLALCLKNRAESPCVPELETDGAPWGVDQCVIDFHLGVIPFRVNELQAASIVRFTARASLRLFSATREKWRKTSRRKGNVTRMVGRRCRNSLKGLAHQSGQLSQLAHQCRVTQMGVLVENLGIWRTAIIQNGVAGALMLRRIVSSSSRRADSRGPASRST
jgi:hypothetical protein